MGAPLKFSGSLFVIARRLIVEAQAGGVSFETEVTDDNEWSTPFSYTSVADALGAVEIRPLGDD